MTKEICIGAQGEVRIYRIDALPDGLTPATVERTELGAIISHSESGHHHVLTGDFDLLEAPVPNMPGMKVLYALLKSDGALVQDAAVPHAPHAFKAGDLLKFEPDREYDPFLEEARRAAD